ncbi:hypothetical protein ACN4EG_18540 [Alkalinema pantanalense CENA528]|uniref:hypothetical protein n=1 Tax=Alkalinema pantanalense TaxID=1620705 RepID=UPI003D6E2582
MSLKSLKPVHLFSVLGAIAVAALVPARVRAEGNCPPGFFPIGGGSAGWVGCAPMDGGGGGSSSPSQPAPPPMNNSGVRLPGLSTYDPKKWLDFFEHLRQSSLENQREFLVKRHGEAAGKTFDQLAEGTWTVGRSPAGQATLACSASFWTLNGGVILMDWKGEQSGTAMMFFSKQIPHDRKGVKRLRVDLVQSGETQNVEVLASRFPMVPSMGMMFFKVPSSEALLSSIEDTQDFAVHWDGRRLFGGEWHSANAMRKDLTECVEQIARETSQPKPMEKREVK